jgi:hypothetical protein
VVQLTGMGRACRAFQNGRTLAKEGLLEAILQTLKQGASPAVVTAMLSAAKRLAVNDEICREFADAGGLEASLTVKPLPPYGRLPYT